MMCLDESRAHSYGEGQRRVYTTPAPEEEGYCALHLETKSRLCVAGHAGEIYHVENECDGCGAERIGRF